MTKQTRDIITIISLLVFFALLIVFGPLAIIWSLNTLFPILAIPYGFLQWLAVIVMNLTIFSKTALTYKKD
jgi:TRAP-type C4-dicarboxylate transport system permease small subunit